MDEDAELAASGARGDVALRMPPAPGQQPLPSPVAYPLDERQPEASGASLPPAAASGANPNPSYIPSGSAGEPLAASGSQEHGGLGKPFLTNPGRPGGVPGRPGIAASMPAALARGGADGATAGAAERRRDARSAEALGPPYVIPCPRDQLLPSRSARFAAWCLLWEAPGTGAMPGEQMPWLHFNSVKRIKLFS